MVREPLILDASAVGAILVVDDQDVVRDVIRLALERAGYEVLAAATPTEALTLARERSDLALIVADVVMPEMDAFELVERIGQQIPGIRVLYTSGYADAREEGPFLQKPFTPSELVRRVEAVLST